MGKQTSIACRPNLYGKGSEKERVREGKEKKKGRRKEEGKKEQKGGKKWEKEKGKSKRKMKFIGTDPIQEIC